MTAAHDARGRRASALALKCYRCRPTDERYRYNLSLIGDVDERFFQLSWNSTLWVARPLPSGRLQREHGREQRIESDARQRGRRGTLPHRTEHAGWSERPRRIRGEPSEQHGAVVL